ncbi:MAG: HEAT repeat domain-containing protein [Deltaproteobacteria bacterium]|nr:HEAT repeat domain-containing protein [Deltaproteobacteria bacterium]
MSLMWLLLPGLFAQELVNRTNDPSDAPEASPEAAAARQLAELGAELAAAQVKAADHAVLSRIVADATTLLDEGLSAAQRVGAAQDLATLGDSRGLPFLLFAVRRAGDAEVRAQAMRAAGSFDDPAVRQLASEGLESPSQPPVLRIACMDVLLLTPDEALGERLYALAGDREAPEAVREAALAALNTHYPVLVQLRGEPEALGLTLGAVPGIVANGVAGGVMLSSIGVLGQSDVGVVIGAIGGSLVGAGTGTTYALTRPLTPGQSLAYTLGVASGLNIGVSTSFMLGAGDEASAAFRAVGVGAGAVMGYRRFKKDPTVSDVMEGAIGAHLGQQLAFGAHDLIVPSPPFKYSYYDDQAAYRAWGVEVQQWSQRRVGVALGGLVVGGAATALAQDAWDLSVEDAVFGGVVGAEGAWIGGWLPVAIDGEYRSGAVRVGWVAGTAAGLALTELRPASVQQSFFTAYGAAAGNALGAGLPMLAGTKKERVMARVMLPVGAAGAAAGYLAADQLSVEGGDGALLYIGVPIVLAHNAALASGLNRLTDLQGDQATGLFLAGSGLGALGAAALGAKTDPTAAQVALVASAGAWGAWYGVLTPIALNIDTPDGALMLSGVGLADGLMVATALAQLPAVGLKPRSTLAPQLFAVGGATLGALGVALTTDSGQAIAGGALVGASLGFGGGTIFQVSRDRNVAKDRQALALLPRPDLHRLPGHWSPSLAPTMMEDGSPGVAMGLTITGL